MARLAGRRALFAVPVLGIVTFGVFAIAAASPFDPVKAYAGTAGLSASQDTLDQLRANLGADEPLVTRWWNWLTSAVQGDLGDSSALRQPVTDVIAERVGWSVLLASAAFLVAVLLGGLLGVLAARRPGGWTDRAVTSLAYTLEAAPPFWLGLDAGRVVEIADASAFFGAPGPRHPYTRGLLNALPEREFTPIPGMPPELGALPDGCAFAARCGRVSEACRVLPEFVAGVACHHVGHLDEAEVARV
ncbi:oligopeptide/dipeptide ABC transporter ATP-binding protein [Streptomyces umbrinus]|uniref:oligopeptide/dipeptide ABC transporter ATP-binding protein n=1 Tax=Streptomyces umbrinus TaxID=67370 RepID=UPI0033E307C7